MRSISIISSSRLAPGGAGVMARLGHVIRYLFLRAGWMIRVGTGVDVEL